jgi:hypothetical protein
MPALPLAIPSYSLRSSASPARVIGWMPVLIESGQGKQTAYLKQQPGLILRASLGEPIRCMTTSQDVLYVAAGDTLYSVSSAYASTSLGTLQTTTGNIEAADNETQVCFVDGIYGYVYDTDALTFARITDADFLGSADVDVLDGYGIFSQPGTNTFYTSNLQDFTAFDPLATVTIEGITGNIVGHIVRHHEVFIFKDRSAEVWYNAPQTNFPLTRNDGAAIEIGCSSAATLRKIGGVIYWLGRDDTGAAIVFGMAAYSPQRISSHALEEKLNALDDLTTATAMVYQQEGLTFYALRHPDLETVWVYEAASGVWHERAEWVSGLPALWRITHHTYCYGVHIVGDADGNIYELSTDANTNDGDTLIRDIITPVTPNPTLERRRYSAVQVDCDVGQGNSTGNALYLMMRYSDDSGKTWSNWKYLSLGNAGNYKQRVRATRLGVSRNRVWNFRVTDDVNCSLIQAVFNEP